jgi:uncharacterized protein involved in cysteine biosynthesis
MAAQRTSGNAIASLVLGIAGFVVFPLVLSILAIVFASKAREEIRANPSIGGDGLATAGNVLGWIGVVMSVVAGLLVLLVFTLLVA